jgi:hypothetical protein
MATGIRIPGLTSPAAEFTPRGGYGVGTPTASGTQGLQDAQTSFDIEGLADKLWDLQPPTAGAAAPDTDPYIAINPSTKKVYVNGFEFDENDASSALESRNYLSQPGKPANTAQGWRRVSPRYYQEYIASIEDPDLGTTFGKNLAVGAGSYTQNLGEFILLASGGKYGAGMVASGMRTQERLSPFVKRFTQVKSPEDVVELFVGSVAQMAPNAAESIITAIAGGIAGGAIGSAAAPGAGTVAGAVGGAAAATVAKASLSAAIRKQFAGEILNASERKLLYQASGAYLGSTIAGYPQAVGDIRSEQRQMGVQDEAGAAQAALTGGVPYALLNSVPEFAAGWSLLSKAAAKGGFVSRGAKGFVIGGTLEGATEVAQEAINVGSAEAFGAQYTDTEKTLRWIDSFAGGALVGGALGGGINMLRPREKPTDLTVSTAPAEPVEPAEPLGIGYEPRLMLGYEPTEARRAAEDEVITPPLYPRQPAPVTRPVPTPGYTVNAAVEPLSPLFEGAPQRQRDTFVNRPVTALEPTARPVPSPSYDINESVQPLYGVSPETLDIPAAPAPPPVSTVGPAGPEVEPADYAPAAPAPAGAPAAAVYTPKPLSGKKTTIAFNWLSNNLSPEIATRLSTSNNVLLAPNNLNIEGLQDVTPSIITVSFRPSGRRFNPIKVAYAEDTYGSPQNFAKAMGFDPAALTTYTRWSKDPTGQINTTDAQAVSAYKKPARRSLRKNEPAAPAAQITKEEVPRAFQKPKPKKVVVSKQTRAGRRVRTDDTARDEAAREDEAETSQAEENPVGETVVDEADVAPAAPAVKPEESGKYSDMSTADLLVKANAMEPKGKLTKTGRDQIQLLKELLKRVRQDVDADKIPDTLAELGDVAAAQPLLDEAARLLDAETETDPISRASVARGTLKKNEVKEQSVRKVVDRILSKLSSKVRKSTNVFYAKSMEDLKKTNVDLYDYIVRSRAEQGDVHTTVLAGIYLRKSDGTANIIMFSDNIEDEAHAALVFLEEIVSHHGFSSLLGDSLTSYMEKIYDDNPEIAAEAEAYLKNNKGVSKAEAVEEVIAKELAQEIGVELGILTQSPEPSYISADVITRLINEIKKLLNKLFGKKTDASPGAFMDNEDVRVLFAKSKQFARTGVEGPVQTHLNLTGVDRTKLAPPFYNRLTKGIQGIKRESAKASVWKKEIEKLNLKKEEVSISGIINWLNTKGELVLTKQEVEGYAAKGGLQTGEIVLGTARRTKFYALTQAEIDARIKIQKLESDLRRLVVEYENPSSIGSNEELLKKIINNQDELASLDKKYPRIRDVRWEFHSLQGGSDYTELLFTLPDNPYAMERPDHEGVRSLATGRLFPTKFYFNLSPRERTYVDMIADIMFGGNLTEVTLNPVTKKYEYEARHFSMFTNVFAHSRFQTRVIDNIRMIALEEIQSEWFQKGQREGFFEGPTVSLLERIISLQKRRSEIAETRASLLAERDDFQEELEFQLFREDPNFEEFVLSLYADKQRERLPLIMERAESKTDIRVSEPLEGIKETEAALIENTFEEVALAEEIQSLAGTAINAPLKESSDWATLVLKRMIRYTAEKGSDYKAVSWFAGNVQNGSVFPVHKAVSIRREDNFLVWEDAKGQSGRVEISNKRQKAENDKPRMTLSNIIGETDAKAFKEDFDNGKKIRKAAGTFTIQTHPGWEFYNITVTNAARKIAKEFGTEVLEKQVTVKDNMGDSHTVTMYYMPLNKNIREAALYEGFSRFARTPAPAEPSYYHGSPNRIEGSLRPSSSAGLFGPGVYLTPDKERARGYAGTTGEVVETKISGKLATRDQWKAATKAASEGVRPSPNAQTEIDNRAIADLEAQGFVGVQAGNTVTVWKPENLRPVTVRSRFSVVSPKDGPKAADRLTNEERAVLGNTLAADVYEKASNGESNAKIAEDLELTSEIVKQIYAVARSKLQNASVKPRARRTSPKKTTKKEQAIVALGTRKADGTYPSVAEVAKQIDAAEATVTTAISEEQQRLADEGKEIPAFLLPPEVQGVSRVFEFAQATTPLYNPQRPVPRDIADALDWLNDRKVNIGQLGRDVLNALKTMNFASRSNAGYREGYRILTAMKNKVAQLRAKYTAMLEDMLMNTDDNVRKEVSAMLQFTTKAKLTGLTDRELSKIRKQYGPLFNVVGNKIVVNPKAFKELSRRGRFTLEEFQRGATREQDAPLIGKDGTPTTRKEKLTFKAMPNLTKNSPSWKLYERVRDTMDQAALDRVEADYAAAFGARENAFRTIEYASNKQLTQADKNFVLRIDQRYREMAKEGAKADNTGRLVHKVDSLEGASEMIAAFNRVLIAEKKDDVYKERLEKFAENFPEKEREEIKKQIESFRDGMTFAESNKYDVQRVVANVAALELGREGTELYAMRSIAGGYIPIGRTGRWQTRIRAVDPKTGQVYGLMESFRTQLPYFQHEDRAAAESLAKDINKLFPTDKATMEVPVFDTKTKQYVVKEVRLEAVADAAREASSVDPAMNINDFQRMITRFGITLTPQERERVIIGMTEQDARARQGLERQNTEGADPDSIPYISQHLVSLANITGRRTYQHDMDALMDEKDPASQRLWNGDPVLLKAMGKRLEEMRKNPGVTEAAFKQAEREYNQLAFEMRRTEQEGGQAVFRDRFVRDLAFLEDQKALEYADFASDGLGQEVRTWTAVSQLGGLVSSAALNVMALPLNVLPGLASYNPKTNFGGGFGMAKSAAAILAAGKDVGGTDRYRAEYYEDLLKNKEALANSGLTRDEAEYLALEIKSGNLQASLASALLASAKGRFGRNPKVQKFIDAYLSAFTYVEQAVSRTAALAAYRLEKERLLDAGMDPDNAQKMAGQFAIDLKNNTVGNYDMYNRPGAFRGGLRDFIFMYKMYPLMVVQLLSSLSLSGKAAMLLPLLLFSGMKGFPGAEDFMDILDTIMQKLLKLPAGSSEKWLTEELNEIAPGLGPVVMRGAIDQIVPGTVSSRVGMGNLIPGTSMFISGSNQFNELIDFFGPAASFVTGSVSTATSMAQLGLSTVGLSGGSAPSVTSILRDSPVSLMRAVGDTIEYAQVGAIVDSKGYVASYDLNASTYISRLLGFYPAAATRENDIVRVNKREADYLREISTEFRRSYVKAALRDDREGMQRVIQKVREWNEASEGTGLEINNFAINARRAVQEARKTSSERYATSAPKSLRKDIEEAQEASGIQ